MNITATCVAALVLSLGSNGNPSKEPLAARVMVEGEELVYEVSWYFVKLGTIRTRTLKSNSDSNMMIRYSAMAYVD